MKLKTPIAIALAITLSVVLSAPADADNKANKIVTNVLKSDVWGLPGSEVEAIAVVKRGSKKRRIAFEAQSIRYKGKLTKRVIRFNAPAEVSGTNFLQVEKSKKDDLRYLYVPKLKRARRISGANRNKPFMGTDFTYADLDRREMRNAKATLKGETQLGKYDVWHVVLIPRGKDAQYDKIEMFVRKDNYISLRTKMYKDGKHIKTLEARELRKVGGRWYITRSLLKDKRKKSKTELRLQMIREKTDFDANAFTVSALER